MKTEEEILANKRILFHILIDVESGKMELTEAHDRICALFNVAERKEEIMENEMITLNEAGNFHKPPVIGS